MFWLSFLIHIPILLFLALFFAKKWKDQPLRNYYYYALSAKIVAGILLGLTYILIYHGKGDTFKLSEVSVRLNSFLYESPFDYFRFLFLSEPTLDEFFNDLLRQPRALIFIKVLSVVNIFTFGNYWVTGMYLSIFSFLGMYHLANSIVRIFKISFLPALIAFLFFPSIVFWSSGVIKESLQMGALGFVVSFFLLWVYRLERPDSKRILLCLIFLLLILQLKFYYFAALVPTMVSCFFAQRLSRLPVLKNLIWLHPFILLLIFATMTFLFSLLHPLLHPSVFIESLLRNYESTLVQSNGENAFYFSGLGSTWVSLIAELPKALLIGLFRPLPGDVSSPIGYVSMFENIFILILFIVTVVYLIIKRPIVSNLIIITAVSLYIIILASLLSIASPNWGTLVRYKVGYLPFLLLLITFRNPIIAYLESIFLKGNKNDDSMIKQNFSNL